MDKIWSLEDEMRKFLGQNFWSHGTPLGSLGPLSQGDMILWFDWRYFLVIWGPCDHPVIAALHAQAEILKTAGAWCDSKRVIKTCLIKKAFLIKGCVVERMFFFCSLISTAQSNFFCRRCVLFDRTLPLGSFLVYYALFDSYFEDWVCQLCNISSIRI